MKKIFTKLMLLAVAAAALVSCENNYDEQTLGGELTQTVTLSAEKPTEVRTQLIEGVPYWSAEDQIGVYVVDGESYKNYAFKNDSEEATLTTSFTGETAVVNTLYVYYPYTNFNTPVTEKGVKVEILANQEPTAASFDGRTDLMIAKPVTLDEEGKQLSGLEFARVAAIVKIVLKDKTGNLAGQHVSSLTMTAANNLVGRVYLDVVNQEINSEEGLYWGGAPSVTATYTEATQYEVNGTNATYVVVYPQTLAAGSKLTIKAATEGYAISKEITLSQDIVLLAGKVTTLNVSLATENVIKEDKGLALPFEDDFARFPIANNENAVSTLGDNYSAFENIYNSKSVEGVKFGTGSKKGSITTVPLNLDQPFTVVVKAMAYGSDKTKVKVAVGDVSQEISLTSENKYYSLEFDAATKKSSLTLEAVNTDDCRFHLDDLKVVAGHDYVLPAVLTVNVESITSISHEGENVTFEYEVANPVEGTSVVITDDAEWITTADNNGTVTVTVAENPLEEVRNATITVKYGDLTKTIAVQQNAKPAEGGNTQTAQYVKVTSTSDITDGQYLIVYEAANIAMNGNLGTSAIDADNNYQKVDITNSTIPSNATTDAMAFTYNATNKSFKSAQGYWIGRTSTSNGLDRSNTSEMTHSTVSISNGNATITSSGGPNLQVYQSGSNYRFRYFRTTQKAVQLYKLVSGEGGGSTPEPEPATPVLSVNPTSLSFDAAAGSKTIACTIENEVSGVNVTATASVDWLSTSVSGKTVTITASENTTTEVRNANVTIEYQGAESKTIAVLQAAAEATEPEQPGGETVTKGEAWSYTFTAKQWSANGAKTLNGLSWTLAGEGNYWGYDATKGQQLGSGGAPYKSMTLSTAEYKGGVETIKINTSGASSINGSFTVSVGGKQIGNATKLTSSATVYTFTSTELLTGDIVISYTQTSSKAIYIKSIAIN